MADDGGTVDLDEDEVPGLVRVRRILGRLLQSDFVQDDETRWDLERLLSALQTIEDK